eukprot:GFYU01012411.1.p1 GENE.GFYU01012411.1~~GFYU01012411.1.p1  ORF type:complete len:230 (-),score=56.54 GFYU01012411.1:55-744(-)
MDFSVQEFRQHLEGKQVKGIVLDIDETLSATNIYWMSELSRLFGNPEGLSPEELAKKYHLAQNVPHWQTQQAALDWMQDMRECMRTGEDLPVIESAVTGVAALLEHGISIVGYMTVRPRKTTQSTIRWLKTHGFPVDIPVVAKPDDIHFTKGNTWKAQSLEALYPLVQGIVDDNPSVVRNLSASYEGHVFLYAHPDIPDDITVESRPKGVTPCETWPTVVEAVTKTPLS